MFGGTKPTFGATTTGTGFGTFNNATTTSPFGQPAFGKPNTTGFGAAPSNFGGQPTTSSLFGSTASQPQAGSLFGASNTSTGFGSTTTTSSFGAFTQPQQNASIFGAAQPTTSTQSLFGQAGTSAFGSAIKPGGFGPTATQATPSLFGQQATPSTSFGAFGQTAVTAPNVFGATQTSAFGQPGNAASNPGTSIAKYQATMGTDTLMKGGQSNNINTKLHCITGMKEYEGKSLEELRMEDYLANRKGPQAGTSGATGFGLGSSAGTGLFGSTAQPSTGLFGQTTANANENKSLFGPIGGGFGQPASTGFGVTANQQQSSFLAKPFGSATTTGFGSTSTDANNPFAAKTAFGQTAAPSLFGQSTAASAVPAFGQANTGFGSFGNTANTQQQQPSLFGQTAADANKPTFGLGAGTATNTGFGNFGTTATNTAGGGLFGSKPGAAFGGNTGFGTTTPANTGFGNFSLNNATTSAGGLFNKTPGFGGFGTQTSQAAPLNFNTGTGSNSLFGNNPAKPGGLFGSSLGTTTNNPGGGLFGGTGSNAFGTTGTLGSAFGGGSLGGTNAHLGGLNSGMQQQQIPIHQQILSKVTSPYGDNPIFKDLQRNDEVDATRATNPAAQKAILESSFSASQQFRVSTKASPATVKLKPLGSPLTKKCLFDGLEELDANAESFQLKPNPKRLILKNKTSNTSFNADTSVSETGPATIINGSRNESFSGETAAESTRTKVSGLPSRGDANSNSGTLAAVATTSETTGRRESWLHPHNLEKVRQHNLNAGIEPGISPNSTLNELVPRKPLETYRPLGNIAIVGRPSVSTVVENPFEDQSNTSLLSNRDQSDVNANSSIFSSRSLTTEDKSTSIDESGLAEYEEHPTGIILRRKGYYVIPSLDDLKSYLAEDGSCIVPNFTVGREGYGNVYFGKEMDVAGLNLDEIVHFRDKQIIIYPDDNNKPPVGQGLNREAQVTLDQVWPLDKCTHERIKDPQRLTEMDWDGKLRRVCDKNETRFVEYRPETGSWVFRVKHFSKYGLNDSDEDDDVPSDAKKAKVAADATTAKPPANAADKMTLAALKNAQKISEDAARALDPKTLTAGFYPLDESAEFMLMDKAQFFENNSNNHSMFERAVPNSPVANMIKDAGIDAHKLQLMKASFFINDDVENNSVSDYDIPDEYDHDLPSASNTYGGKKAFEWNGASSLWKDVVTGDVVGSGAGMSDVSSPDFGLTDASPHLLISSPASIASNKQTRKISQHKDDDNYKRIFTQELPPFIVKPKVAPVRSLACQVPLHRSIAYPLRFKWAADLGLYNSCRFKIGFGPQQTLIVPTTHSNITREVKPNSNLDDVAVQLFKTRSIDDYSTTVLQHIKVSSTLHYENFKETIVEHLNIQLRNSQQQEVVGSECPYIKSDGGTELILKHLDEAIKLLNVSPLEEYAVSVWSLCLALWGDHEELEGRDPTSHFVVMCRRSLLSEWLENTLTDKDLLTKNVSRNTYLDHLLELVMCHKVTEACELAFSYDDVNLSLLLSQLSSGPRVRQLVEDQLAAWHADQADEFIQLERLKLFMLVAGVPLMSSFNGDINCLEGIEWIKVLALQLWYLNSPVSSITDALISYDKCFQAQEFYSQPPIPTYMEEDSLFSEQQRKYQPVYDLRYHLLQLFSKRSHPLESLLNPATHTPDPMDYRLSWLLLQTLEALGYHHCSELSEAQLHTGFASQLESHDLWEWSIFVLLHIKDRNQRGLAVQNVLYRYVMISKDVPLSEKEKFVINNLGVPEKWVDYAKAVKAGSLGAYHLQAKYLLKAKQWSLAHEVIFQRIVPDAIINDNLDYLHGLLSQFESPDLHKNIKVPNWSKQGQIFFDFININEKFKSLKSLKSEADIEAHWENLKPQLADLCSRIKSLPCPTTKHSLCQSEIAQNLACLLRGVLLVCPVLNPCNIITIALELLPLPQEFAQRELRHLLDTLVDDLSKPEVSGNDNAMAID
ncbi:nuclear pore complex protein Nup98-Nup96 [Glossina fuscipes]|uniref:Nuclear pore complex protein Nup98-Nup96 n=1 Tax=Glossina fuscipes TaxID=7396 RepID=A0A9C6DMG2_9MUSC|nr:nuclear pore complex protein Nup98-Nup96 [Glossina fuscipes]